MSVQKQKYGPGAKKYALLMLEKGVSYKDVNAETGIEIGTLRAMKCNAAKREKINFATPEIEVTPPSEQQTATAEIEHQHALNEPKTWFSLPDIAGVFNGYDLVYYVIMGITCYGVVMVLQTVGYCVAGVYCGVAIIALQRAKRDNTGNKSEVDLMGVLAVEFLIGLPAHIAWINQALWSNLKTLPISVFEQVTNGEWGWVNGEWPFYIACYLAFFLSSTAVYAVYATVKSNQQ